MEKELRIIISGGGTGGHIFPAVSIANAIIELRPDAEILFVGPLAYPPTPTATCGRKSLITLRAFHWLRISLINTDTFFHKR